MLNCNSGPDDHFRLYGLVAVQAGRPCRLTAVFEMHHIAGGAPACNIWMCTIPWMQAVVGTQSQIRGGGGGGGKDGRRSTWTSFLCQCLESQVA